MKLSLVEQLAIEARMAAIVGVDEYDRLFFGFRCTERDSDVLFVEAIDAECAMEIENRFVWQLTQVATKVLKCEIGYIITLPRIQS